MIVGGLWRTPRHSALSRLVNISALRAADHVQQTRLAGPAHPHAHRHLSRLVLTHAGLVELSSTISSDEWARRWETHYQRLCSLLKRHTTEAERAAAMKSATEHDRNLVTRLLDGGYSAA